MRTESGSRCRNVASSLPGHILTKAPCFQGSSSSLTRFPFPLTERTQLAPSPLTSGNCSSGFCAHTGKQSPTPYPPGLQLHCRRPGGSLPCSHHAHSCLPCSPRAPAAPESLAIPFEECNLIQSARLRRKPSMNRIDLDLSQGLLLCRPC